MEGRDVFREDEGGGGGGALYRNQKRRKSHIKLMWDSYLLKTTGCVCVENLWDILLGDATITRARNMPFQEWIDSNLHNNRQ